MPYRIAGDEDCEHNALMNRGKDVGDNKFLHCQDCGAVVVFENKSENEEELNLEKEEEESDPIKRIIKKFFDR